MTSTGTTPLYASRAAAPEHLQSKNALRRRGLKPHDEPDAYIAWPGGPVEHYAVFDSTQAIAIPGPPDKNTRHADRQRAAAWARHAVTSGALMLDTETTGLHGHVVEISVVAADASTVFTSLVQPGIPIEPAAEAVHGITDDMLATAPTLGNIAEHLDELLTHAEIIGWNTAFDRAVLRRHYRACGLPEPTWLARDWHDAMHHHAAWVGEWNDTDGTYRWQRCEGEHRSASDCVAAWTKVHGMAGTGPDPHTLRLVAEHITRLRDAGDLRDISGEDTAELLLSWIGQADQNIPAPREEVADA